MTATGEQRVEIEHLDAPVTRRDVLKVVRIIADAPDDAAPDAVIAMIERALTNPNASEAPSDAGDR